MAVLEKLKYTKIKSKAQYKEYCKTIESLLKNNPKTKAVKEEIELLSLLIRTWDDEQSTLNKELDPIKLLKFLMKENKIKQFELAHLLQVGEGQTSDILNYKKRLTSSHIRVLSERFKVRQEAFNREYSLKK